MDDTNDGIHPRRTSRQRKSANETASISMNNCRMIGTQTLFNNTMKSGNSVLVERMRSSILYGAILVRLRGILHLEPPFVGADGRTYPDIRLAFNRHANIEPCSLCKSRVQGAWYCRIRHGHFDKPDHDGGNSAVRLEEMSRMNIDELEGRLCALANGGVDCVDGVGRINKNGKRKSSDDYYTGSGTGWSMDDLGEDLLFHIASFVPKLSDLSAFCSTSNRARRLLQRGCDQSEDLLRGVFHRTFGTNKERWGNQLVVERDLTWRRRWMAILDLRRGIVTKSTVPQRFPTTLRVLPARDEEDAIHYDNPGYADPDIVFCNGYFGVCALRLHPPPNAGVDWQSPFVVRGDFDGVRIIGLTSSIFHWNVDNDGEEGRDMVVVGNEEGGGQVLSLLRCDPSSSMHSIVEPCCFIGYASGRVAAISATLNSTGDAYTFAVSCSHHAHESEVTALTFVDCNSSPDGGAPPVLFSACCAGKVYFYPHAFDPDKNYSLEQSILAITNFHNCPIFTIASTTIMSGGRFYSVLCTGDRNGNIRLWLKPDDDLVELCSRPESQKFCHIQHVKSSTQSVHLVTHALFVHDNLLITGTNNGDVRFWQMNVTEVASRTGPHLTLRYDLMGIHNGAVELLTNVGDVLLSSGGNDGNIVGWDINTGRRLGTIQCHSGTRLRFNDGEDIMTLRSCVVDMLLSGKEGSLISLCRDGSLRLFKMNVNHCL